MFARQNAIALLALFVALGGTGYAAATINGRDIKKGTIRGSALKNHTLTSKQINKSKLGKVKSASTADFAASAGSAATAGSATSALTANNANDLGGVPASGYLTVGCGPGRVNGYAKIVGVRPGFPNTYTSSALYLKDAFNCSAQAVEVRRQAAGKYFIKFPGNPGTIGFGNWEACVPTTMLLCSASDDHDVAVTYVPAGADAGSLRVLVEDTTTSAPQDDIVDVLIP